MCIYAEPSCVLIQYCMLDGRGEKEHQVDLLKQLPDFEALWTAWIGPLFRETCSERLYLLGEAVLAIRVAWTGGCWASSSFPRGKKGKNDPCMTIGR